MEIITHIWVRHYRVTCQVVLKVLLVPTNMMKNERELFAPKGERLADQVSLRLTAEVDLVSRLHAVVSVLVVSPVPVQVVKVLLAVILEDAGAVPEVDEVGSAIGRAGLTLAGLLRQHRP